MEGIWCKLVIITILYLRKKKKKKNLEYCVNMVFYTKSLSNVKRTSMEERGTAAPL